MSLKNVVRRVVVTGGLALTALLISHPDHALMAKTKAPDVSQATIYNSGSANRCAYSIQVASDGHAFYSSCNNVIHGVGHIPWFLAQRFFSDLEQAGPLSLLPHGIHFNTGGYGTRTTVVYGAQSTPVLDSDSFSPSVRSLYHDADEIWRFLNFPTDPRAAGTYAPSSNSATHKNGHLAQMALAIPATSAQTNAQPQEQKFIPYPPFGHGPFFPPFGHGPFFPPYGHGPFFPPYWHGPFFGPFPYTESAPAAKAAANTATNTATKAAPEVKTNGHLAKMALAIPAANAQPQEKQFFPYPPFGHGPFFPPFGHGPFFPPYGHGPFFPPYWHGPFFGPFPYTESAPAVKTNGHLAQMALTVPAPGPAPHPPIGGPHPPIGEPHPPIGEPHPPVGGPHPPIGGPHPPIGGPHPPIGLPVPHPPIGGPHPPIGLPVPHPPIGGPHPPIPGHGPYPHPPFHY